MVVADPEKSAKAQHGVRDSAAHLVDHDALDRSDLGIVGAIHCGSFHLVAADKGAGFSCFRNHLLSLLLLKNVQQAAQRIVPARWALIVDDGPWSRPSAAGTPYFRASAAGDLAARFLG